MYPSHPILAPVSFLPHAGKERSFAEALACAGLDPDRAMPCLALLDLTDNRICHAAVVNPLRALPQLQRLLLAGNPLAAAALQVGHACTLISFVVCIMKGYFHTQWTCRQPHVGNCIIKAKGRTL